MWRFAVITHERGETALRREVERTCRRQSGEGLCVSQQAYFHLYHSKPGTHRMLV